MRRPARLAILTRDPVPGTTKTRLIPALGAAGAASLHREMVAATLDRALASELPVTVFLQGDLHGVFADWMRQLGIAVVGQPSGDLGARIGAALEGAGRRLVIGTDSPTLSSDWLLDAADAPGPVVLGPAPDGGYWLLGVDASATPLLETIPWSTPDVLATTCARAASAGLNVSIIQSCADVDEPADLNRLLSDPACPPAIVTLIERLLAAPDRDATG